MKTIIGDFISLISGNTNEDFEPTKQQFVMFYLMIGAIALFALISYFLW